MATSIYTGFTVLALRKADLPCLLGKYIQEPGLAGWESLKFQIENMAKDCAGEAQQQM
jgi:hypothetical protein